MKELDCNLSADNGSFDLGEIVGRRRAFVAVAGGCSAADAACIKRIRDGKIFKHQCKTWEEFCRKYLGMTKANANRLIRELEEFGAEYFHLSQLTRISAQEYRAIRAAVRDGSVHCNGEAIALIPENSEKVAKAVAELRRDAKASAPPEWIPPIGALPSLEGRGQKLAEDFTGLLKAGLSAQHRSQVGAALQRLHVMLYRIEMENR